MISLLPSAQSLVFGVLLLLLNKPLILGEEDVISASVGVDGSISESRNILLSPQLTTTHGVDVSWPMHRRPLEEHSSSSSSYTNNNPLGDHVDSNYLNYMNGCHYHYESDLCDEYERDRLEMNLEQPPAMINYTSAGFAKLKAPASVRDLLTQFWHEHVGLEQVEAWPPGNIYTNHWRTPTKILNLANETLVGASAIRRKIVEQVGAALEAWTGQALVPTSLYGIRIYQEGAILAPHVDRLPLVTSAIINVAQDVDEPWLLEVIGHDGKAYNITMEPGDMVLYESHSVIHGRPFPLKGRFYANVFIHFEPMGYTERHAQRAAPLSAKADAAARKLWEKAQQRQRRLAEQEQKKKRVIPKLPHYIREGTAEATQWRQMYAFQRSDLVVVDRPKKKEPSNKKEVTVHVAAATGDLELIKEMAAKDRSILFKNDDNGWQPIHEAARGGQTKVVEYLIAEGANINQRTNNGFGATPRWLAEQALSTDHPTVKLLRKLNALKQGPMEEVDDEKDKDAGDDTATTTK